MAACAKPNLTRRPAVELRGLAQLYLPGLTLEYHRAHGQAPRCGLYTGAGCPPGVPVAAHTAPSTELQAAGIQSCTLGQTKAITCCPSGQHCPMLLDTATARITAARPAQTPPSAEAQLEPNRLQFQHGSISPRRWAGWLCRPEPPWTRSLARGCSEGTS